MKKGYRFPYNNGGIIGGINDSGIETFKGTPIYSITKETIQNALDAKLKDNDNPVVVKFNSFKIKRSEFPYVEQFRDILESCKLYWSEDSKTMQFLQNGENLLCESEISILEIGDYNTTGLKGSKNKGNSSFNNLVKSSGVSNKADDAGGSFGIGKNAPYTASGFRTVIYSTLDEDGTLALQGVSKLVTHKQDNRDTQGVGFLGITQSDEYGDSINRAFIDNEVKENINTSFIRKEKGTSIFITGFEATHKWEVDVIKATIDYYMMAIIEEKLEVEVQGILINKESLKSLIEQYFTEESSILTLNYYKSIMSEESATYKIVNENFEGMGKITLYLYIDENLPKKVAYIRSNGMKIIDKDRFRVTQQFTGVLHFEGKEINKFIRSLENPSHDKIEYRRHSKSSYAKKILADLSSWIKECVKEQASDENKNIIDAEGMGEYLPDNISEGVTKVEVKERLVKKISAINIEERSTPNKNKVSEKDKNGDGDEKFPGREQGDKTPKDKSTTTTGNSRRDKDKNKESNTKSLTINKSRVFSPQNDGTYRVILESEKKCDAYFELRIIGEDGNEKAIIKNAYELNGTSVRVENSIVGPIKFNRSEKKVIEVKLDKPIRCAMEVMSRVNNL